MTSHFQDGGHNVRPPLAAYAYAAASAGCSLARRARVTSVVRCIGYTSWSIIHSYLFLYFTCFYFTYLQRVSTACYAERAVLTIVYQSINQFICQVRQEQI